MQQLVTDLGARYRELPGLWQLDDHPEGFTWIDAGNVDQNVASFVRVDAKGRAVLACIGNFAPVVRYDFRVGLPVAGRWTELINTDSTFYGGSGQGNLGGVETEPEGWNAFAQSARMTLPPLAVVWLSPIA